MGLCSLWSTMNPSSISPSTPSSCTYSTLKKQTTTNLKRVEESNSKDELWPQGWCMTIWGMLAIWLMMRKRKTILPYSWSSSEWARNSSIRWRSTVNSWRRHFISSTKGSSLSKRWPRNWGSTISDLSAWVNLTLLTQAGSYLSTNLGHHSQSSIKEREQGLLNSSLTLMDHCR